MNNSCLNETIMKEYQHHIYAAIYSIILVPGLIGNVLALWVFHIYIKETKKAVIFMINLAMADLLQVLSLPLRIYYYLNHSWPFGQFLCMFCFYLKYVNMYASIVFLAWISVRRCRLIIYPLHYQSSKRNLDRVLCAGSWLIVCLGCLAFPLLRRGETPQHCFSELPMVAMAPTHKLLLLVAAELLGFFLPLGVVVRCTWLTAGSLREKNCALHDSGEKRKALKMVLSCAGVFVLCFVPYHVTFPMHFLAKSSVEIDCSFRRAVLHSHPVTLCLASLNSCLDPIMYYFTTDEFKRRLSRPELPDSLHLHRRTSASNSESKALQLEQES